MRKLDRDIYWLLRIHVNTGRNWEVITGSEMLQIVRLVFVFSTKLTIISEVNRFRNFALLFFYSGVNLLKNSIMGLWIILLV